ncbi:MAG: GDYXXLXY domain-containing protein [Alphaproteobacteria bacterium]|nr:GDYXXLXY domain-containing protein [Alphaproteobacteria bacterium]
MKFSRSLVFALFLALPVVGVLSLVAQKEIAIAQAQTVRIPIKGYDPRSLLYGHYLRFQFDGPLAPDSGVHEYYIPEAKAARLQNILFEGKQKAEIDVRMSDKKVLNYGELYIGGKPYMQVLAEKAASEDPAFSLGKTVK